MNSINRNIVLGICSLLLLIGACTPMDHYYSDLIEGGNRVYTGKADSLWALSGKDRIRMMWISPPDPTADQIRVFWNNGQDSISEPIENQGDTGQVNIAGLSESVHTFNVLTIGNDGNRSLPVEIQAEVFGDTYQSTLRNRVLRQAVMTPDSTSISWHEELSETLVKTDVYYQDKTGGQRQFSIPRQTNDTTLYDIDSAEDISFQSFFLPVPSAIDTFETEITMANLSDYQLRQLTLAGAGTSTADYIDFATVTVHKEAEATLQSENIDIAHLRGSSSKHNLIVMTNQDGFRAFSSSLGDRIQEWPVQNGGLLVNLGGDEEYATLYEDLDEKDRSAMKGAFDTAAETQTPVGRLTQIQTGDIILFNSIDRGIYVAIRILAADDNGDLTIEFKISAVP